jgi:hydrogenase-4 component B
LIASGAVAAILALLTARKGHLCARLTFGTLAFTALMGLLTSLDVILNGTLSFEFVAFPFLGPFHIRYDALSAFFLLSISVVGLATSIYSIGYSRHIAHHHGPARLGLLLTIFLVSMCLVVGAGDVVLFLVTWELMSLSSYLLVVFEDREEGARSSGWLYFVMTHIGTACIAAALIYIAVAAGSLDFEAMATSAGTGLSDLARSSAFLLALVGFGIKAGMMPLHVWLPKAHPAAPSNVSALMSGVMVKVAVYMLIRTGFEFLGVMDTWWGLLVLFIGSITALLGVLYALAERDIKRALAFSTVENVGIILIALAASMVFFSYGQEELAALALVACLLHVLFHSLFKSLLFLGAGAVVQATGTKDMERMGGLAKRMRYTSMLFFVGALSISAIPPFNGFVSEWLIFQSLLHSYTFDDVTVNLLMAIALGMLALTGALAAACFVRIYGAVFLARPRSPEAEAAREPSGSMLAGMTVLAALCLLTGVMAAQVIPLADKASVGVVGVSIADQLTDGLVLQVEIGASSSVSPLLLGLLIGILVPVAFLVARAVGGRRPRVEGDTWDCGTPLTPRNEYTATGHSQPVRRVFQSLYGERSLFTYDPSSSPYSRKGMSFSAEIPPRFERFLYEPVAKVVMGVARRASVIQTGSIQTYLAYIFATLVLLLLVFR